jgi:hypothetical protein
LLGAPAQRIRRLPFRGAWTSSGLAGRRAPPRIRRLPFLAHNRAAGCALFEEQMLHFSTITDRE